ncbi:phage tail tape measure protein [Rahnella sp. AA]|uniref:phage tail tape measure protein n=1 Tax=Rahnella sp. AA TaxID=2057180 RepID=UPI000C32625C|nr:phage tail tape measure protein [Rahnella sp. AA]PKE30955.1 phage tail tape measure protein [Rahnella sp. AA]
MAGDIATISLKVNTSDVERGSNELDKFADAAADAAKGADNFGTSGKGAAKVSAEVAREVEDTHRRVREFTEGLKQNEASTKGVAQATAQQQQELRTLLTQINPVTAAFEKLDNMEQQLSRFNAKGLIDSDTFRDAARTIQQAREELGRAADARTEEGRAAAAAAQQDKAAAAAKETFLSKLRDQNALYKTSASEAAEYRASQLGITQEAAPLIAAMRQQEDATRRDAEQKRLSAQSSRVLKQAIAELEAAERSAAQEEQRAANTRQSFIKSLSDQANAIGKTRAEILELKAAELGVTTQVTPFIARLKEQESAMKNGAVSAGQYRQAMRQLPAQLTDVVTSLASGMPVYMVAIQQGGQIKDSFGGIGAAAKALSTFISPMNLLIAGTAVVFGGAYLAIYKAKQVIDDTTTTVTKTLGVTGDAATKLALNIIGIADASNQSVDDTSKLFITISDGADQAVNKMLSVGIGYSDAKKYADDYKNSADFSGLNSIIEDHKLKVLGIKSAWNEAIEEQRNYYAGSGGSKQNVSLGGAYDPAAALIDKQKTLLGDVTSATIAGNLATKERVDWINKEYLATDRVAGAEARLTETRKKAKLIADSGDKEAIANAGKLIAAREKEVEQAKKSQVPKTPKQKAFQDDAGTRELLASQQRVAALKDQVSASLTLTSQEQQLAKFTQQIADLKSKTILTADQKSLLARSGEITASLQLEAQLSRENVQREKAVKALKQMQDYTTSIVSKNAQNQEKFGLTTKQAGRVDQETQLDNTFRKQTDGITDPAALTKITAEYNRAKDALRSGWDQEDANQGDWLAGMNQGISQFGENASDVFTATSQLAQTTLSDMSSMMTSLVTTGKANLKDFAKSFLTSIVDIINKLLLAQAVQAAMGWISSSFAAGAGSATAASSSSFSSGAYSGLSFDSGGYTGEGDKYAPAGIVHRGEFVMTKEATSRIGVDNLYSMMRGYADGGLVGAKAGMFGLAGSQSNSTIVQTSVVVQAGSNQQQTSGNNDAIGKAYQQVIDQSVKDGITKALRPGGLIYNAQNSR